MNPPDTPAVEVADLAKTYRSRFGKSVEALRGVTLRVEAGEVFGLLGPNGAGKTTLLKILLGAVEPSRGAARLFGLPASNPAARARIGFLPEHHRFPDFLTANQFLSLFGRMSGMSTAQIERQTAVMLGRVGMSEWGDSKLKTFSKGMLQRIGIAQALLSDPKLIFLDEPTDGVDPVGRRDIRDLVASLREEGVTVFLNSHLLSEVEQICTRVAIMRGGTLQRVGTVAELTQSEASWTLSTTPIAPDLATSLQLAEIGPSRDGAGLTDYRITTDSRAVLNEAIDVLRSGEVEIAAVSPQKKSLEESFIDVVTDARELAPTTGSV
jgi:ABC-2 type transport system ATP-binding protein